MKQFIRTLVSTAVIAASVCLFSCDNDTEGFGHTGKNGLPSTFKTNDQTIYLSYSGNRIQQIMEKDGSTSSFEYEGDELKWISFAPPADPNIADGHGIIRFEREGNKILTKRTGEPSFELYINEIELDENGLPAKIIEKGATLMTSEGEKKVWDGKNYSILTFDPSTHDLLKLETFSLTDSKLVASHTFKYDTRPGSMSQVELPVWFFAYWYLKSSYTTDTYIRQFLNYRNTLTEETITDGETGETHTIQYKYTYNENSYPITIDNGEEETEIRY